jgi:hypothetical protein
MMNFTRPLAAVFILGLPGCAALDADERGAIAHAMSRRAAEEAFGSPRARTGFADAARLNVPDQTGGERLVMAYFTRADVCGLSLATSDDGLTWTTCPGGPVFTPRATIRTEYGTIEFAGLRDPCVARGPDGWFHLVWTWQMDHGWVREIAESIGYARSRDLLHWEPARVLRVMKAEGRFVHFSWAPEINWDEARAEWLLTWAAPVDGVSDQTRVAGTNARIYACRTRDFTELGPTSMFFDPGFPVIDQTIVDTGSEGGSSSGRWLMVVKDERSKPKRRQLKWTAAAAIDGPWRWVGQDENGVASDSALSTGFTIHNVEGPSVVRLQRGIPEPWLLYYDLYEQDAFGVMATADFRAWRDVSTLSSFPPGARHGSVFHVPEETFGGLINR